MKKYLICLYSILVFVFGLTGCGSNSSLASEEPQRIAVFNVLSNPSIPWNEKENYSEDYENGDGVLSAQINKRLSSTQVTYQSCQERLTLAYSTFEDFITENTGNTLIPAEELTSAPYYEKKSPSKLNFLETTTCLEDYKLFKEINGKPARVLMQQINADRLVILQFNFYKEICDGNRWNGKIRGVVELSAIFVDKKGHETVTDTYTVKSEETVEIESRYYDPEELVALFPAIIPVAVNKLCLDWLI